MLEKLATNHNSNNMKNVKDQDAYDELMTLREQVKQFLNSEERFQRVYELVDKEIRFWDRMKNIAR